MTFAVRRMTPVTASTKRAQVTQGQRTEPMHYLTLVKCAPLDPVDPETKERMRLDTPHGLLQTFTDDSNYDIRRGDILVVGTNEYPIKDVAVWAVGDKRFLNLFLEDLRL